jgi:hypothetical protein
MKGHSRRLLEGSHIGLLDLLGRRIRQNEKWYWGVTGFWRPGHWCKLPYGLFAHTLDFISF